MHHSIADDSSCKSSGGALFSASNEVSINVEGSKYVLWPRNGPGRLEV